MKSLIRLVFFVLTLVSCAEKKQSNQSPVLSLRGTWRLTKGIVIDKKDTIVTDYTKDVSFIKIINETHFAFFHHDLDHGKGNSPVFVSGGGSYSLRDSSYTEHLEYCTDRAWEGNDFTFIVEIRNDTLIQRGVEKIEKEGIDRINIEHYIRLKP